MSPSVFGGTQVTRTSDRWSVWSIPTTVHDLPGRADISLICPWSVWCSSWAVYPVWSRAFFMGWICTINSTMQIPHSISIRQVRIYSGLDYLDRDLCVWPNWSIWSRSWSVRCVYLWVLIVFASLFGGTCVTRKLRKQCTMVSSITLIQSLPLPHLGVLTCILWLGLVFGFNLCACIGPTIICFCFCPKNVSSYDCYEGTWWSEPSLVVYSTQWRVDREIRSFAVLRSIVGCEYYGSMAVAPVMLFVQALLYSLLQLQSDELVWWVRP